MMAIYMLADRYGRLKKRACFLNVDASAPSRTAIIRQGAWALGRWKCTLNAAVDTRTHLFLDGIGITQARFYVL